jgi:hypothetical protein
MVLAEQAPPHATDGRRPMGSSLIASRSSHGRQAALVLAPEPRGVGVQLSLLLPAAR